jgi:predicted aconitase with swiveling domain
MLRSSLAVLAGILVLTAATFAIEAVVDPLMNRNVPGRIFTLAYTLLCVAAGGYVTAWLARRFEVRHAVIMGVIEAVFTIGAMMAMPGHAPIWSWISGIVLVVPAAWFGGMLRAKSIPATS